MDNLIIYGAGGAGRELASNLSGRVLGFIDDTKIPGEVIDSLPVLGGFDGIDDGDDVAVCIVGDPKVKKELINKIKTTYPGVHFPHVFCQDNTISDHVQWGEGCIVAHPYNVICPGVQVGKFVWVNAKNSIGHNCSIGDFTTLYSGIFLGGESKVGENCVIGTGAIVNPGVTIGNNVIIGAGSVVVRDIPDSSTAVGIPAKVIKSL
jgi:sugar O-acyltransferase (sialic acid O-acetyltransferase NeuD family)